MLKREKVLREGEAKNCAGKGDDEDREKQDSQNLTRFKDFKSVRRMRCESPEIQTNFIEASSGAGNGKNTAQNAGYRAAKLFCRRSQRGLLHKITMQKKNLLNMGDAHIEPCGSTPESPRRRNTERRGMVQPALLLFVRSYSIMHGLGRPSHKNSLQREET